MILFEIGQFLFILSIIFVLYVIVNTSLKAFMYFKLGNQNTTMKLSNFEKTLLVLAIAFILTYLI